MMTAGEALRAARSTLAEAGVPTPAVDAALLLSHVTGVSQLTLRAESWRQLTQREESTFFALVERRKMREPLQYITGEVGFMYVTLRASPDALIPRADTERLCEEALSRMQGSERVLDLCTGTGALAIAIKHQFPAATVLAGDISEKALALAKENAARNDTDVEFRKGDLLAPFAGEKFDLIVSNPPYVTGAEMKELQPEVQKEPELALYGGEDGLDFYRRIVQEAPAHLKQGGWLLFEIGSAQAQAVSALMEKDFEEVCVVQDYEHLDRVVLGKRK